MKSYDGYPGPGECHGARLLVTGRSLDVAVSGWNSGTTSQIIKGRNHKILLNLWHIFYCLRNWMKAEKEMATVFHSG